MNSLNRHVSNILDGVADIIGIQHSQRKYRITKNGFHQDHENLRNDVKQVGNDIQNKAREAYVR